MNEEQKITSNGAGREKKGKDEEKKDLVWMTGGERISAFAGGEDFDMEKEHFITTCSVPELTPQLGES